LLQSNDYNQSLSLRTVDLPAPLSQVPKDKMFIEDKVNQIYLHALTSNLTIICISLIYFFLLKDYSKSYSHIVWPSLMAIAAMYRLSLWYRRKYIAKQYPSIWWLNHYTMASTFTGIAWGSIFLMPYVNHDMVLYTGLLMVVFGVTASAVSILSVSLPIFFVYTLPIIICFSIAIYLLKGSESFLFIIATTIYYGMLSLFAKNTNQYILKSMKLEYHNQDLIQKLQSEIEQRELLIQERTKELNLSNRALTDSKNQLQNVINGAELGYWDWYYQTGEHIVNDHWLNIIGLKRSDILNKDNDWSGRIHPDDRPNVEQIIQNTIKKDISYRVEFRMKHADGSWVWIEGSGKVLEREPKTNEPIRLCGTHQDISIRKKAEETLQDSINKFRALTETTQDFVWEVNTDGVYTYCSPQVKTILGYEPSELIGKTPFDLMSAKEAKRVSNIFLILTQKNLPLNMLESTNLAKDGREIILETSGQAFFSNNGEFEGYRGIDRDITQRKQADEALKESEARFRKVFEKTDAVSVQGYNKDHQVIYWNPASEAIYGYSAEEALGKKLEDLIIPDEMQEQVRTGINNWINGGEEIPSSELTLKTANGTPVHVFSSHIMVKEKNNDPEMYCIDIDLTLHKEQADKIRHQAFFDSLTDLPNRLLVLDRLTQLINEAKRVDKKVAVLFLDLDDFKKINDTLGHETGDKLLIESSKRLLSVIRAGDTVGRFGGDEFIFLLGGLISAEDAQPIAENLLYQFRKPFIIDSRELRITVSTGISIYPDDGQDPSVLLKNADSAMYDAKEQGRNAFSYFTDSMNHIVSRRLALEEQIYGALTNNEFEIYYQPKIGISSGKIIGAEALLRWNNPVLGNVSPVEFIPICEQTGLIISIGKFVLENALKQTVQWQHEIQSDFHIAVNLSPSQFRDPSLIKSLEDIIKKVNISAHCLELEITEGVLMNARNFVDEALTSLNNMGISITMDDFGTGYSSLSYLRRYPFNILKIDRSFINDLTVNSTDRELINATIVMAHALKIEVVAEGVETVEQLELLKKMNCDIAQGYLYSKPVTVDDFTKLLEAENI